MVNDTKYNAVSNEDWLIDELEIVFNATYDSIFITDRSGNVIRASKSVINTCGIPAEELIGQNVFDLEERKVFYPSNTKKVLKSGKREQLVQTTGSNKTLLVDSTPIKDEIGNIVRIISISKDISEIHHLEEQIQELNNLLQSYQSEIVRFQNEKFNKNTFIVKSKKMENLYKLIKTVAFTDSSVLILGETGVGKEVVANQIHILSQRYEQPFITLNCGAIPETLLESELFGYEEGAFSGARKKGKPGIFEVANKGTVFLDEIGDMPVHLQVKLLRVLQEKKVMRLGSTKEKEINVRIVAATNRELENMVKENKFREDLYYRINVIPIRIPPLRERREDLSALTYYFLEKYNRKYSKTTTLSEQQLKQILEYHWPGNVRELINIIERLVVTGQPIHLESKLINYDDPTISSFNAKITWDLFKILEDVERSVLLKAKEHTKTTREMAKLLGLNQSTVVRKLQKYRMK